MTTEDSLDHLPRVIAQSVINSSGVMFRVVQVKHERLQPDPRHSVVVEVQAVDALGDTSWRLAKDTEGQDFYEAVLNKVIIGWITAANEKETP